MSIHPSLSTTDKGKRQRTVLKRIEKIKHLIKKGEWTETSKVYGLPKIKLARLKVKKEKAAEKPEAEAQAQETTAPQTATAAEEKAKPKEKS